MFLFAQCGSVKLSTGGTTPARQSPGPRDNQADQPDKLYEVAQSDRRHGRIHDAESEAETGYNKFLVSRPEWAGKFRILQIQMMMVRGRDSYRSALRALDETPLQAFASCDLLARKAMLEAYGYSRIGNSTESEVRMRQAEASCKRPDDALVADLALMRSQICDTWTATERYYRIALTAARRRQDSFREAGALDGLAVATQGQERYDESIDYGEASLAISESQGYQLYAEKAEGTLAFDYFKLGDFDRSLELLRDANQKARDVDAGSDKTRWPNNLGLIYEQLGQLDQAESSYRESLTGARQQDDEEQITIALAELAYLSIRSGKWDQAESFTAQALEHARQLQDRPVELDAQLAHGSHPVPSRRRQSR